MAAGTIALGTAAVIKACATAEGSFEPVSDLNSYNHSVSAQINQFPVFQRAAAHGVPAADEVTLTLSGLYSVGDSGQGIIRTAKAGGTNCFIQLLPDGTNGILGEYRVASITQSGTPNDPANVDFEFALAGDEEDVGDGL